MQAPPLPPATGATLSSLDPTTLKQRVIKELGQDFKPEENFRPGIRFNLSPDGESIVYSTSKPRYQLWMLQGYRQPSWFDRCTGAVEELGQR